MNQAKTKPRQLDAPQSREIHFDLQHAIAEAAYFNAEKRGFIPGFEEQDWTEAETLILSIYMNDDTESQHPVKSEVLSPKRRNKLSENTAPMPDNGTSHPAP